MAPDESYLSAPPDVGHTDLLALSRAVEGGWIGPLGPQAGTFQREVGRVVVPESETCCFFGEEPLHQRNLATIWFQECARSRLPVSTHPGNTIHGTCGSYA